MVTKSTLSIEYLNDISAGFMQAKDKILPYNLSKKNNINRSCPYYESFNGQDFGCQLFGSFRCDSCTKGMRGD